MSTSLRNVVQRRNHKERGQLAGREKLGLLEKKKDYLLRARDYHSKQKRLKALREKALFRNPDEFYFKMINTSTKNGVHIQKRNEELPHEMVQLLKSQDKNYIKMQRDISKKKMEKLQDSLHFLDEGEIEKPKTRRNKHIVFVDTEDQAKSFDVVKHLDTAPELVHRKFNRPRIDTLKQTSLDTTMTKEEIKEMKRAREMKYKELQSRKEREKGLKRAERELEIQKAMNAKGERKKIGVDKLGLPVYKWKADRKR
ncbi:small-subunit processome [Halteromyces radiatus]|uniref:small-subunit processome n=1 Tax=Halteromyces radiatus TaxID=101107 RepID=UPI00221F68F7|nr:small-subunit processome [Halteromyces radiatus]KAI8099873.1 small-subunit processome [Halteromyces radiatus]